MLQCHAQLQTSEFLENVFYFLIHYLLFSYIIYKSPVIWSIMGGIVVIKSLKIYIHFRYLVFIGYFQVQIVSLEEETSEFTARSIFDHPYPTTKIMWIPDSVSCMFSLVFSCMFFSHISHFSGSGCISSWGNWWILSQESLWSSLPHYKDHVDPRLCKCLLWWHITWWFGTVCGGFCISCVFSGDFTRLSILILNVLTDPN